MLTALQNSIKIFVLISALPLIRGQIISGVYFE